MILQSNKGSGTAISKHSSVFLSELKAKIIIIPDGGHFSVVDNCFEFPEVVNEVISLAKIGYIKPEL